MPYAEGRVVHDADSHMMEPPGYALPFADPGAREALEEALGPPSERTLKFIESQRAKRNDPEYAAKDEEEILLRKNHAALGAIDPAERSKALDYLGFAAQLVFTTEYLGALRRFDANDADLAYPLATAHNRAIVDFCSGDKRLLPVCFVPFTDIERAAAATADAIELGAAALMISSACPKAHSPSHIGFDKVWAQAQEAGIPIVMHVGGEVPMNRTYKENGLPAVPDFHGGDANFTSVSFMAIPYAPMQTLAVLIIDGVLERFPDLKFGVIELGASWVPGWMHSMDSAADAFRKNEERLQKASLKPSEYVRRQVRVCPYPHEPAGWIVKQVGPEVAMFSSDYPHVEGGRNPLKRFEASMADCTEGEKQAFYSDNFVDLMGSALH